MEEEKPRDRKLFAKKFIRTVVIIIAIMAVVKLFVLEPFLVKGTSMEPNFQNNNYIFVQSISTTFGDLKRGDVVIFQYPEKQCSAYIDKHPVKNFFDRLFFVGSIPPSNPCTNFIKRVIGLPEETVAIKDGKITIKNSGNPGGFALEESYMPKTESYKLKGDLTRTLGKDEYFVLGDNRQPNASLDSREWGALPKNYITGKAWVRILPINRLSIISGPKY